ncbi:hypothetical protein [Nocardia vaccinii]|uniref:hypothetical protein n=1 Tax=Nocardia vaccinii TaxID=1822 RepID=UPI000A7B6579|nr:hypothetical protein [Nocardia vaccinii]
MTTGHEPTRQQQYYAAIHQCTQSDDHTALAELRRHGPPAPDPEVDGLTGVLAFLRFHADHGHAVRRFVYRAPARR